MIKAVLFDLDGTLLPMDQDAMIECYMRLLAGYMAQYEYEPKTLVKTVWQGTEAMMADDTGKTNEEVFWDLFRQVYGPRADTDKPLFEEFYAVDFPKARTVCGFDPAAGEVSVSLGGQWLEAFKAFKGRPVRVKTALVRGHVLASCFIPETFFS